jgi:hypothetical protein
VPNLREQPQERPPDLAALMASAEFKASLAALSESPGIRSEMYAEADEAFARAIAAAPDEATRSELNYRAVETYVSLAQELTKQGESARAREAYRRAKGYAAMDPALMSEIDKSIDYLGG